eukprot:CAMPEP_0168346974 /NCGR_PEP_ID=MMETSP0213-20121227/18666_1 /TAXON_ID=151035 /ORGANISM="Euplotes harpa, Strain FSP1.4" /LENGTH=51 /DNA_ID=CAMNT_0008355879 /DNA_START=172 /DNA_END=323 /DNA_ORIENTATION=-
MSPLKNIDESFPFLNPDLHEKYIVDPDMNRVGKIATIRHNVGIGLFDKEKL